MHAGMMHLKIESEFEESPFPALVLYPTPVQHSRTNIGPFEFNAELDAPLADGRYPLVVISHGGGGSHLVYRTICTHLASHGFIIAVPEHPGNNRNDNSRGELLETLEKRPRHISAVIDTLESHPSFKGQIDTEQTTVIGHSMGGYTALALAGGTPWTRDRVRVEVRRDGRVKQLVLMAPAAAFYTPEDSLEDVDLPILLFSAEHDPITPAAVTDLVVQRVPDASKVKHHFVENAGHLSFLTPYPSQMRRPDFPPSWDPDGFDRDAFDKELPGMILGFIESNL